MKLYANTYCVRNSTVAEMFFFLPFFAYPERCPSNNRYIINIKNMFSVTMLKHNNFYKKGLMIF